MCGRTCLTLSAKDIICACCTTTKTDGDSKTPTQTIEWRPEYNLGKKYAPSHNIAPTEITPVLISAKHFDDESANDALVLMPMMWGLIPVWHKGDYRKHGLSTNNCRLESMLESKLYSSLFKRGQRCVILCEGFYEWQTTKKTKKASERAAHFLYMPQKSDSIKIYDKNTWNCEDINLLKMAGIYDIWTDSNGDKMYSYAIITFQSSNIMSWLHERMPAILETDQQVSNWLNFTQVTNEQALSCLRPAKELCWYQVSNQVNNSRNKLESCNNPLTKEELKQMSGPAESQMMKSWLLSAKREVDEPENEKCKKIKFEEES